MKEGGRENTSKREEKIRNNKVEGCRRDDGWRGQREEGEECVNLDLYRTNEVSGSWCPAAK